MNNAPALPTFPLYANENALACLNAEDRENIDSRVELALDGIMGWAPVIAFTQDKVEELLTDKQITSDQAHDILEYVRSF